MLLGGTSLLGDGPGGGLRPEEDPWEDGSDGFDMNLSDSSGLHTLEAPGDFNLLDHIPGFLLLKQIPLAKDNLQLYLRGLTRNP
jgi:hypothetical protein